MKLETLQSIEYPVELLQDLSLLEDIPDVGEGNLVDSLKVYVIGKLGFIGSLENQIYSRSEGQKGRVASFNKGLLGETNFKEKTVNYNNWLYRTTVRMNEARLQVNISLAWLVYHGHLNLEEALMCLIKYQELLTEN